MYVDFLFARWGQQEQQQAKKTDSLGASAPPAFSGCSAWVAPMIAQHGPPHLFFVGTLIIGLLSV